jgi:hypothetical protein
LQHALIINIPVPECIPALPLLLLLLTASSPYAGFDLTIEPESGYQTKVPDGPTDSSFGNYPYCALGLEPSWTADTERIIRLSVAAPLNATKYIGGTGELSFAPALSLERTAATHTTIATVSAGYYYLPAAYDPIIPENFLEFSLEGERENRGRIPLAGTWTFSVMTDLATSRTDFKNSLQLTLNRSGSPHIPANIKIGCSGNISTLEGASYIQPRIATGMSIPFSDRNLLLLQLFAAYSLYKPAAEPVTIVTGRGRWGKKTDTLVTYQLTEPRIPLVSLYCGYDRELTSHMNLHFYYMATFFGRGRPDSMQLSHQSGIIFSWSRK